MYCVALALVAPLSPLPHSSSTVHVHRSRSRCSRSRCSRSSSTGTASVAHSPSYSKPPQPPMQPIPVPQPKRHRLHPRRRFLTAGIERSRMRSREGAGNGRRAGAPRRRSTSCKKTGPRAARRALAYVVAICMQTSDEAFTLQQKDDEGGGWSGLFKMKNEQGAARQVGPNQE